MVQIANDSSKALGGKLTFMLASLRALSGWKDLRLQVSFDGGPGMYESGPFGEGSGAPVPVAVETFHALQQRQIGEAAGGRGGGGGRSRINLLNWDGNGVPAGLFPDSNNEDSV